MAERDKSRHLRKDISLLGLFAISIGATLSSGFFLLPGIAAQVAGPAVVLVYVIALAPLLPGILSKVELSTAMPRAGGVYFFVDRSIGPMFGAVGGIGTWFALILKVAFALVGMGAYLTIFWPDAPVRLLAVLFATGFGVLNVFGTRKTSGFQIMLVTGLLLLIVAFIAGGAPRVQSENFDHFWDAGTDSIFAAAGLVCVSYVGLTKVASVSEEVRRPDRDLPRAMFLAVATASLIYAGGTWVMVGVLSTEKLSGTLTPVADTAQMLVGKWGAVVMTVAAMLAFFSVANAGILSASRYPLAMSRDQLMPAVFQGIGRFGTPTASIVVTVAVIILAVLVLNPLRIAKLAGAFQLMLFAFNCLAVLVMRGSRIASYDPGYKTPFFPWLQIVGVVSPFLLIAVMGWLPILFTAGLIAVGLGWYVSYGRDRITRQGALSHVMGTARPGGFHDLDRELRGILKEKGLREQDPFDQILVRAIVLDAEPDADFESIVSDASTRLSDDLPRTADALVQGFMDGTRTGATPVAGGVALPHLRIEGIRRSYMALVRCRSPIHIESSDAFGEARTSEEIHAIFFLVSPEDDPGQHLRLLAQLASRVDQDDFTDQWMKAGNEHELRDVLLEHEEYLTLSLVAGTKSEALIDLALREVRLPEGSLIAVIRRDDGTIVPGGNTTLREGDRITIIGTGKSMSAVRAQFEAPEEKEA